jgi:O-antigen biosynthesis protein
MTIDLSIIIPYRDRPDLTLACLSSLEGHLKSTSLSWEIVLVDNGSAPATVAAIENYKELPTRSISAPIAFNFQRLINLGAAASAGRCLLLLNNDIVLSSESRGFVERFVSVACQPDVGCVGCLLRYPDGTIQHAGVVVGMNTFADHLYRGWSDGQAALFPFAAPTVDREVSAVTAACLAIERRKFADLGGMDEAFVVCGGDVDLCLRAKAAGYRNLYLGTLSMVHAESKSRDPAKIPDSDFSESQRAYSAFLARYGGRDPYYPAPLPLEGHAGVPPPPATQPAMASQASATPSTGARSKLTAFLRPHRRRLKELSQQDPVEMIAAKACVKLRRRVFGYAPEQRQHPRLSAADLGMPWMAPIRHHPTFELAPQPRLNILLPHFDARGVFGGILTAALAGFVLKLRCPDVALRFIFCDGFGSKADLVKAMASFLGDSAFQVEFEVEQAFDRDGTSLVCHRKDVFMATAWWTCYSAELLQEGGRFLYFIQDFEPCFYPWGEEYAGALATYGMKYRAVFNTDILRDYFFATGLLTDLQCSDALSFNPAINKPRGVRRAKTATERRVLLFYGRRSVARNLFATGVQALARAIDDGTFDPAQWDFISAGEPHEPIELGHGVVLRSLGKMKLEDYLEFLARVDVGLSLMLSPHPSYPPLEMSNAGAITVTNSFANKDLSHLNVRIVSCEPSIAGVHQGLVSASQRVKNGESDVSPSEGQIASYGYDWVDALGPTMDAVRRWILDRNTSSNESCNQ